MSETQGRASRLHQWVATLIACAAIVFSAGQYFFEIKYMEIEIERMRNELARKDVLQGQLDVMNYRLSSLQESFERNEKKMDEVLRYIK